MQRLKKNLIKALILPWMNFSLISCSSGIQRPDAELCVINAVNHEMRCYSLRTGFTDAGTRRIDVEPRVVEILGIEDVHRMTCTNPDGLAEIKRYISELKEQTSCQP